MEEGRNSNFGTHAGKFANKTTFEDWICFVCFFLLQVMNYHQRQLQISHGKTWPTFCEAG